MCTPLLPDHPLLLHRPPPAARACKNDAIKFCNVTWFFGYKAGQVISCLREFKNQVDKKCKKELFKAQKNVSVVLAPTALQHGYLCLPFPNASLGRPCRHKYGQLGAHGCSCSRTCLQTQEENTRVNVKDLNCSDPDALPTQLTKMSSSPGVHAGGHLHPG